MRVNTLHYRVMEDVRVMYDAVSDLFPVQMPARFNTRAQNVSSFVKALNKRMEPHGVFNERKYDLEIEPGKVFTSGLYLNNAELPENGSHADIRILWHAHPATKRIQWTQALWNRRRMFFWTMFMHESIHRHQDAVRPYDRTEKTFKPWSTTRDVKEQQNYLGAYDEIETHSHDAAVELYAWWGNLSFTEAVDAAQNYTGRMVTPTYKFFTITFDETPVHPAVKAFKKKVRDWYDIIKKYPEVYDMLKLPNLSEP